MTNAVELLQALWEATLATSVAVLLVLGLRRKLRLAFGARVAYGLWALVPVALLAALSPVPAPLAWSVGDAAGVALAGIAGAPTGTDSSGTWRIWIAVAWMAGVIASAFLWGRAQAAFRRRLGSLVPYGECLRAGSACDGLPVALGLWRPRIVLPADFELRYTLTQRLLIVDHERAHIARGDLHANAAACVLRCLFWFNPLLHAAAARFRHDQELACDADVIATRPQARRAYGEALLHAQLEARMPLPGCHFGFGHPLKERIAMLKQSVPSSGRRLAGNALVVVSVLGVGFAAWAAQPQSVDTTASAADGDVGVIDTPAPKYPDGVARQGIGGKVILIVDVGADGSVTDAVVEHAEPAGVFDAAALEAAKQWKFTPKTESGKPVAGRVRVPIWFEAKNPDAAAAQS